ncbi:MAG: 3-phosphoshikimate 1-carboxyvinyltransferase [Firmicutes bacterium]|nr:3-phosphoshikimate 1-carboxyvinyltransferase [Bacillota bacterium]
MQFIITAPQKLQGELKVPGDKSITHRALMLGALATGITTLEDFLEADDCRSTMSCLRSLGVTIGKNGKKLQIKGLNMVLQQADAPLYAGNSGTTARLLLGILAGQPFKTKIIGDQSLSNRPMRRVAEPLVQMGASITDEGGHLPLTISGGNLRPLTYNTPQASAQVKSAVLLAGLFAEGKTTVIEPAASRNHTELMLKSFGAEIETGECRVMVEGRPVLKGHPIRVPGDISAAAFFMVAAVLVPGSKVLLKNVGINLTRSGVITVLQQMGADLELRDQRCYGTEPVADLMIHGGVRLNGVTIAGAMIPRLIDELPVLAVAATAAVGRTVIRDAGELRVKESDRIHALSGELRKLGAHLTETEDGMIIEGSSGLKGARVDSCGDHRIAMSLAVAGLIATGDTNIAGAEAIAISYPQFMADLRSLAIF